MEKKKKNLKWILKIVWIIYASFSVLVWMPKIDELFTKDYDETSKHVPLEDSWDISINGDLYEDITLDEFHFQAVSKGDKIVMQRELPRDWDLVEGVLRFSVRHSAVNVYVDGQMIHEYGHDRLAKNKTLGSGYQFVDFPNEYQGKNLKIELHIVEDKIFTKLDPVGIYEWKNAYRLLMTENRIPMLLGCFLFVFGLITTVITIFALAFSLKFIRMFCIAVFALCMGMWTLCYYNVILVFSIPLYSVSLLEYLMIYLAPLPITVYMYEDVKNLENKLMRTFYWAIVTVQLAVVTVGIALHTLDIVHMAATLRYMQIIIIAGLVYFIVVIILNLKSGRKMIDRLYLIGMLAITICVGYDILGYRSRRYQGGTEYAFKGATSIGVVIFIFIMICSFYIDLTQKMMQETERNFLIKSAYTDELTKLHNRRYCMEYINKFKESRDWHFTVICFDLNNLKTMNDTYGHAKGDILIKSAADVIAESFEKRGMVARMGGDEFIAVLETADEKEVSRLMEKFQVNVDKKNKEIPDLNMTIACGRASGSESENDIEKIYQIADDRMYENKKQMKLELAEHGNIIR